MRKRRQTGKLRQRLEQLFPPPQEDRVYLTVDEIASKVNEDRDDRILESIRDLIKKKRVRKIYQVSSPRGIPQSNFEALECIPKVLHDETNEEDFSVGPSNIKVIFTNKVDAL